MWHDLISKHSNIALQFSGGRDSLAMLLLLRPYWDRLTVYYCNSGDALPETTALVAQVARLVPRFVQVNSNVHVVHATHGWPSDILPAKSLWPAVYKEPIRLLDRHTCCFLTLMKPLHERMIADGVTLILRGQRDTDDPKSVVKDGEIVDGFQIGYPIAPWSIEQVEAFIEAHGFKVPAYYAAGLTSAPDCLHCTAWLEHKANKYVREHHPQAAERVSQRLAQIKVVVQQSIKQLDEALHTGE